MAMVLASLQSFGWLPFCFCMWFIYINGFSTLLLITNKTPYEGWYGRKPDITPLKMFRSPVCVKCTGTGTCRCKLWNLLGLYCHCQNITYSLIWILASCEKRRMQEGVPPVNKVWKTVTGVPLMLISHAHQVCLEPWRPGRGACLYQRNRIQRYNG
jgi:hypothetical protein